MLFTVISRIEKLKTLHLKQGFLSIISKLVLQEKVGCQQTSCC